MMTKGKLILLVFMLGIIFTIPSLLFTLSPNFLLRLTRLSYFFLIFAIFLACSRAGSLRLGTSLTPLKWSTWLVQIILAEIVLGLLFFSIGYPLLHINPLQPELLTEWGLHPWPLVALFAVSIGYGYYEEKRLPLFSSLFPTLRDTYIDQIIKRMLHFILGAITSFYLALIISLGAFQLSEFFISPPHQATPTLQLNTLAIGVGLLSLSNTSKWKQHIHFLCRKGMSIGGFYCAILIGLAVIIGIENALNLPFSFPLPTAFVPAIHISHSIVIWAAWLGFIPLISSFITRISYGRSIRAVIFAVLIPPAFVYYLIFIYFNPLIFPIYLGKWLALCGPLLLILFLIRAHTSHYLIFGCMPHEPKNIVAIPRPSIKFINLTLQNIIFVAVGYSCFQLPLISFLLIVAALPCITIFLWMSINFYARMIKKL